MRNNQVLQRLGVSALASIVNSTNAKKRGGGPQLSGSLYDGQDSDGSEEDEVSKVHKDVHNKRGGTLTANRARTSKRVMAPEQQEQPTRVTRQRTAMTQQVPTISLTATTQDALASTASPSQNEEQIPITEEDVVTRRMQEVQRKRSMGKELDRISRGLGTKLAIQIFEGKRRPEAPMQAAKLASEGGIILRKHIPILPRWKDYKENPSEVKNYIGKIAGRFTIDVNSKAVTDACVDLMKGGQRQMRYRLKKKYFNGVPANEVCTTSPLKSMTDDQWKELVEMWSTPKHKDKCIKNCKNREQVKFQQRTGSQCFIAKAYVVKQEKYKDTEPSAIDLFKDTHCSKNNGFSESVKKAIVDMEAIVAEPVQDGQQPKSSAEVVSEVLPQSSTFLRNVGLQLASKKSSGGTVSVQVQDLQAQLEAEKQEATGLRQELHSLKLKAQESKATMERQSEEIESLKKTTQETNALLRQMISFNRG
ncbi:unnamed protein product [Urochloa humidicola]